MADDVKKLGAEIRRRLQTEPPKNVPEWRRLRRAWSGALKGESPRQVIALGQSLLDAGPWGRLTAYEIITLHPGAIEVLTESALERLGRGLDDWAGVDTFACYLSGPAWREGVLSTRKIHAWLRSPDRWRRRIAVVSTVALNVPARGGRGDVHRTLDVAARVVSDRDDMVVKALSWALRSLVMWDRDAVAAFLDEHRDRLAARVRREVTTKLRTGRKNAPSGRGGKARRGAAR